jgi:drug/metabolite transporter (DMT)-like permease
MSLGSIIRFDTGQHRFRVMLAFGLVYLFWGSTYLAMRVAVREIPPYAVGGTRYMISGPLLLAACALVGRKIRLNRHDFARLLAIGVLLLSVSNISVLWAEEYVPSGLTALIVALVPIFVVALEAWVFRVGKMPLRGLSGLALGMVGLLVLLWPKIISGTRLSRLELMGAGILACGSLIWSFGSILSHRWNLSVDVFVAAAWQMTLAGLVNTIIALATGQFLRAHWTAHGLWAIIYLVVAGSWLGFTAYIWLLEHVLPPKVATYAYVNPIVALLLGWLLLNEHVDAYMLAGTAVIIGAVALVNTSKLRRTGNLQLSSKVSDVAAVNVAIE